MIIKPSDFKVFKKNALNKLDKSSAGGIDKRIQSLCNTINQREDMFTLSSCSGRTAIQKDNSNGKQENIWIFTTHNKTTPNEIKEILSNYEDNDELIFLQEAMILHVCVNSLELANQFIHIAKTAGLNQCGIISSRKKIVVEVICDARIELPVYDKEILINDKFIEKIVNKANQNQEKSWKCINKLEKEIIKFSF